MFFWGGGGGGGGGGKSDDAITTRGTENGEPHTQQTHPTVISNLFIALSSTITAMVAEMSRPGLVKNPSFSDPSSIVRDVVAVIFPDHMMRPLVSPPPPGRWLPFIVAWKLG